MYKNVKVFVVVDAEASPRAISRQFSTLALYLFVHTYMYLVFSPFQGTMCILSHPFLVMQGDMRSGKREWHRA